MNVESLALVGYALDEHILVTLWYEHMQVYFLTFFSVGPVVVHIGCLAFAGVVVALLNSLRTVDRLSSLSLLGSSVRVGWLRPVLVFEPFRAAVESFVGR